MRKLRKLVRDPRRFILDSKAYRRSVLITGRFAGMSEPVAHLGGLPTAHAGANELAEAVLQELARSVPLLEISDGAGVEAAILREHLPHLAGYLYDLSRRADMRILAVAGDGLVDARVSHLFRLDDALSSSDLFALRFEWPSSNAHVEIAFQVWNVEQGYAVGPAKNLVARRIPPSTVTTYGLFQRGELKRASSLHPCPLITSVDFPVDIVYTWVNHRDPAWKAMYKEKTGREPEDRGHDDATSIDRYMNRDELKFSLRSVGLYAPWVRKVYVVSNCAPPDWLRCDTDDENALPSVVWVDHSQIIPQECLPTFNSHAIESRLHHIPGLADHFVYFNDDFFLTRPTDASDFFHSNGLSKSIMEPYGTVIGPVHPDDPDYLNAARNGKRLIEESFGRSPTCLHKHTPYSLRRDVLLEMEERFKDSYRRTTASAFRTQSDVSTVSFLYHHYAYVTGRAAYSGRDAWLVKPQSARYQRRLASLLESPRRPVSVCLNDGAGSVGHSNWNQHVIEFLKALYPDASRFEV